MDSYGDPYGDVKLEPLHHIPPYMDEGSDDDHESGDDGSKRPRLRLGRYSQTHHRDHVIMLIMDTVLCSARACDRCK